MNYLNPHTHDLSSNRPRGYWIARPECIMVHELFANGLESPGGFRDRGDGYDHEHYEPIPRTMSGPAQRLPDGTRLIEQSDEGIPDAATRSIEQSDETLVIPQYKGNLNITDAQTGEFKLQLEVKGSAHVVSQILTWTADAFKEDQER